MITKLIVFLGALRQNQHSLVMDYFFLSALSWAYLGKIRSFTWCAVLTDISAAISIFAVFTYAFALALYLLYPNYLDHFQAVVASTSWFWLQGHELYPNWTTGQIYGFAYGPMLFVINGTALLLKASIFASKLPGVLSLGSALGATWALLAWKTGSRLVSLILSASMIMVFSAFNEFAYWNRAEPFLILLSAISLLLAFRSSSFVAVVGIGVLTGIAAAVKIHGFIYTIPAAAAALARVEAPRRLKIAIVGSACAVTCAALPFFAKGVSIIGYLRFLRLAFDEGLMASGLIANIFFAVVLTAPIIVIWIWRKPALHPSERCFLAALGPSLAVMTIIGAKRGGGEYYLLPLVPVCIYAIVVVCVSSKTEIWKIASLVFFSYFLAYSPNLVLGTADLYRLEAATSERERGKIAELKTYLASYPEAQIGVSDDEHYESYFYGVYSVWNGHPLDVDFSVWGDLAIVGTDEGYILRFVKACTIPVWILPLGRPFMLVNSSLLSENFRQTFLTNYRQIETGQAYQVWKCKS